MKPKRILLLILTISIIVTSFSSVVQISAQTKEGASIQTAQVIISEDDRIQTASIPVEPNKEFMISNENDFTEFMTDPEHWESNVKVTLACDIDMKGKAFNSIKEFGGVFDGCGHTISNLKIQNKSGKGKKVEFAFINTLNEFAEIKNVKFDNYTVDGKSDITKAAGLVITNHGTISGVDIINGSINGIDKKVKSAGFALNNEEDGVIENCNINNISSKDSKIQSGFVGTNHGKITKSSTTLTVNNSKDLAGGFCAINSGLISYCKSDGSVKAIAKKCSTICGGFIGDNSGIIKDCSSTGKVEGQEYTGGFVGINNDNGEIISCKSICDVKSHTNVASIYCGGFVGLDVGKIEDCSFDGTVYGCVDSEKVVGIAVGVTIGVILIIIIAHLLVRYFSMNSDICKNENLLEKIKNDLEIAKDNLNNKKNELDRQKYGYNSLNEDENKILKKARDICDQLQSEGTKYVKVIDELKETFDKSLISAMILAPILAAVGGTLSGVTARFTAGRKCAYVGGFCGLNMCEITKCSANIRLFKAKTLYNKYNMCGGFVGINGETGTIKRCNTTGNEIHNKTYTGGRLGGFVGDNSGKIENGTTTVSVTNGKCTGGFCGNNSGEIISSRSKGGAKANAKTVETKCGGFVGINDEKGKIYDCTSTGSVIGQEYLGGFCGDNKGEIAGSKSEGNATASIKVNINKCGGFVGKNSGIVKDSGSTGSAIGEEYVGGFAGVNKSDIIDCNAHGKAIVKTKANTAIAGGFVGENEKGTIIGCKATGGADSQSTSGQAKAGGFVGINKAIIMDSKASGYVYLSAGTCHKDDGCGGFVGRNDQGGSIDGCYAECILETTNKKKGGGFVGEAKNKSTIINSKCKSKIVTKAGIKDNKKFCQDKDKKAIIENCYAE